MISAFIGKVKELLESAAKCATEAYPGMANCYAFAFNLPMDPRTGKPFNRKPQPGEFSGNSCNDDLDDIVRAALLGRNVTVGEVRDIIINAAQADGQVLGFTIEEVDSANYPTQDGQWVVALAFGFEQTGRNDYHWWRRLPGGYWFHKPGEGSVEALDSSGNIIFDPGKCDRGYYTNFMGYFLITPSN